MPYPKPLSEKNLLRLYSEAKITEAQKEFLRTFFTACANLYGVLVAEEAWNVYKTFSGKTETVRMQRKNMYAALRILRRETVPFYVFEADEVFSDAGSSDKYRVIVSRELVSSGYGKLEYMFQVMDKSEGKPFYVPENLPDYVVMPENPYETRLLDMLGKLKCTLSEYEDVFGKKHSCKYTGRYLKDFSYIGPDQEFELELLQGKIKGYKGNEKKAAEYAVKIHSITAAQYLVDLLRRHNALGDVPLDKSIRFLLEKLNEMGVSLSEGSQMNELLSAINDMSNNQHLWCNHGWTPCELFSKTRGAGMPAISFGPGMQKAFADGSLDKEELMREFRKMGLDVAE